MILVVVKFLIFLSIVSHLLPLLTVIKLKNRLIVHYKPIFIYIIVDVIFVLLEIISTTLIKNSNPIHHISTLILFSTVLYYFYTLQIFRKGILFFFFIALSIFIYETILSNKIMETNFLLSAYSNFVICIISFLNLFKLFNNDNSKVEHFQFQYYVAGAFFVFNSSSFFMSLFETQIRNDVNYLLIIIYPIYSIINIFQNVLLTKGIWFLRKI
jgi:hypothetical protein